MERQFFSGNTIEQAVMAAARHYGLEPERVAYKTRDKKHGFLNIRRRVVIEVDPEAPEKPEVPADAVSADATGNLDENSASMNEEALPGNNEGRVDKSRFDGSAEFDGAQIDGSEFDGGTQFDGSGLDGSGLDGSEPEGTGFDGGAQFDGTELDGSGFDGADFDTDDGREFAETATEERVRPPRERPRAAPGDGVDDEIWRHRVAFQEEFAETGTETDTADGIPESASEVSGDADGEPSEEVTGEASQEATGEANDSAKLDREIAAFKLALHTVMDLVEMEFESKITRDEEGVFAIDLEGEDGEYLVEREGLLLRAVEHLLPRLVRGLLGYGLPCRVDCNGFQEAREAEIRDIAGGMAELARRQGKAQKLKPMSPADRRLVHLALADDPTVHTESEGSGYMKRVRVSPV